MEGDTLFTPARDGVLAFDVPPKTGNVSHNRDSAHSKLSGSKEDSEETTHPCLLWYCFFVPLILGPSSVLLNRLKENERF